MCTCLQVDCVGVNLSWWRGRLVDLQVDLARAAINDLWGDSGRRSSLRGRGHGNANDLAVSILLDCGFLGWGFRCRRLLCAVTRLRILLANLRGRSTAL